MSRTAERVLVAGLAFAAGVLYTPALERLVVRLFPAARPLP